MGTVHINFEYLHSPGLCSLPTMRRIVTHVMESRDVDLVRDLTTRPLAGGAVIERQCAVLLEVPSEDFHIVKAFAFEVARRIADQFDQDCVAVRYSRTGGHSHVGALVDRQGKPTLWRGHEFNNDQFWTPAHWAMYVTPGASR